jgi:polar amino acid transport system substrate-binding protein
MRWKVSLGELMRLRYGLAIGAWRRVALAAVLCLAAPAAVTAAETITLCFERADVPPWRTVSGAGLNFELLKLVEARLGIVFDFQSMPWKRCLAQLKANEVGGAFAVSFKPDRLELGEYPGGAVPDARMRLHIDRYVLLRRKGSAVDWDGKAITHLQGTIGAQLGYSVGDFLRALNVPVDEGSQRAGELAQKLVAGRLGAAALGGSDAQALMAGPMSSQLEVLPLPLIEKPYFLVLSHALVASNPALAARIWRAVEEVRSSAQYRKLTVGHEGAAH